MAVTQASLTSGSSNTNASSYSTASVTPPNDSLVLVAVQSSLSSAVPNTPTLSGNGITWAAVANVPYANIGAERRKLTLFRGSSASPSAGAITIDFASQTQDNCSWSVSRFSTVDTTTNNGVVQSATNVTDSATSLTATLGAFSDVDNATYGAFTYQQTNDVNLTPGSGFTQIHEVLTSEGGVPVCDLITEWRNTNDTSVDAASSIFNGAWAGIAVEIKEGAAASSSVKDIIGTGIIAFPRS